MSTIDNLLSRVTQDVRKLLEEAYEAGRDDMRKDLDEFLKRSEPTNGQAVANVPMHDAAIRARAGTVKPAIKILIGNAAGGITASEIVARTGFKENSVRGTLAALRSENFAERRGELWIQKERLANGS
jgi:hypothetical protein